MDLHARQQFDFLLGTAVERFVETLEHRNEGSANALAKLESNSNAEGVWLTEFVNAIFQDFLLDNVEGSCFVLQAVANRSHEALESGVVVDSLTSLAKQVFADLLLRKTKEALAQRSTYQSVHSGGHSS